MRASALGPYRPVVTLSHFSDPYGAVKIQRVSKLLMRNVNPDSARGPDYFSCVKAYPEKPPSYCKSIYPLPSEEGGTAADSKNGDKKKNGNGKEDGKENGEGLSTTAKVGIAAGVAALLGTGFYFYKKRSVGSQ
jgi:hypothetical protein